MSQINYCSQPFSKWSRKTAKRERRVPLRGIFISHLRATVLKTAPRRGKPRNHGEACNMSLRLFTSRPHSGGHSRNLEAAVETVIVSRCFPMGDTANFTLLHPCVHEYQSYAACRNGFRGMSLGTECNWVKTLTYSLENPLKTMTWKHDILTLPFSLKIRHVPKWNIRQNFEVHFGFASFAWIIACARKKSRKWHFPFIILALLVSILPIISAGGTAYETNSNI